MSAHASALTPGLYGKMPAHGDFVRRGWDDDVVDALDRWLASGLSALRESVGEDAFPDRMRDAPAWAALLPGGIAGSAALYVALAPSVDRAGRFFFLAAGFAGSDEAVAGLALGSADYTQRLDAAMYQAASGAIDADGVVKLLAGGDAGVPCTTEGAAIGRWWPLGMPASEPPAFTAATLNAALLHRLLQGTAE